MTGCGEADVPFSPEGSTTDPNNREILTHVATVLGGPPERDVAGVSIHGNYAYVGGLSIGRSVLENIGVRIVDVSDPTNPELVARIPLRQPGGQPTSFVFGQVRTHGDAVATSLATAAFEGDVAIVLFGVPDDNTDPAPYGIWDVTDPRNPTLLSVLNLGGGSFSLRDGGDLGAKPPDSKAAAGNYFYTLYVDTSDRGNRLAVVDISDPGNPVVVGDWQDNGEVQLMGLSLNQSATRAYITGQWPPPFGDQSTHGYLYVLDIQNPSQPTEIGRYVFPLLGVPSSVSIARPTSDDALVVLADHSWERTKCGILHILDASNLAAISEISSFALPGSSGSDCGDFEVNREGILASSELVIATDVAIRGNVVYSTWLKGGVRAIDISDPANPVEVGSFTSGIEFSDIALLGDDYVVATHVWDAGMVIFRTDSP